MRLIRALLKVWRMDPCVWLTFVAKIAAGVGSRCSSFSHSVIVVLMKKRHVICLVVDGLRASALGTYGNTSFPTHQLDAMASRSLVVDWLWADSPLLDGFYRSVWQGQHALRQAQVKGHLIQQLADVGVQQWLISDDTWLTSQSIALPFDKTLLLETVASQSAETIEDAGMAQLFYEVVLHLEEWRNLVEQDESSMLWFHTSGLMGPWDAPIALRQSLLDEADPDPLEFVNAPGELRDLDDPDEIYAHRIAYAAQMAVLSTCVGAFMQAIEESFAATETLVMLFGSRGYALGEHGSVGRDCQELFGERLHVPWLLQICGKHEPFQRYPGLTQPADIGSTLLDWFGLEFSVPSDGQSILPLLTGQPCVERQVAVSCGVDGEQSIRTAAWHMRKPAANEPGEITEELYAKPDDLWEFNNVASICPQVMELLREGMQYLETSTQGAKSLPVSLDRDDT